MKPHAGQTEVNRILCTDFTLSITTITGHKDSTGSRYVLTTPTEPLTKNQVALLIIMYGSVVHNRTLDVLSVDLDICADLEGDS